MASGVDCMPFVFLVPVCEVRGLVHVLDDLPPADARVVSAEGDFAFLSAVRNHAHFLYREGIRTFWELMLSIILVVPGRLLKK